MAYAEGTKVDAVQSRNEIEKMIARFGGEDILLGTFGGKSIVQFRAHGRYIRLTIPTPDQAEFSKNGRGSARTANQLEAAMTAEIRRRWRCLVLLVKAKFAAIADGIVTFEDEFMAETVMPNGQTAKEQLQPQITAAYQTGKMDQLQIGFGP